MELSSLDVPVVLISCFFDGLIRLVSSMYRAWCRAVDCRSSEAKFHRLCLSEAIQGTASCLQCLLVLQAYSLFNHTIIFTGTVECDSRNNMNIGRPF